MNIMQRSIKRKTTTAISLIIFALGSLALPQRTQAVSPPPDGGYAGGNTAEGQNALLSLTSGLYNTGVGVFSLLSITDGNFNTGVGAGTLLVNTASGNTATGAGALLSNTTGVNNTAGGTFALFNNTEGSFNTATGDQALLSNDTGTVNTANGAGALANNTSGDHNTAIGGDFVLISNTTGSFNTAVGVTTLSSNTSSNNNTAVGAFALQNNTGGNNVALGHNAGHDLTTGNNNIDIGNDVVGLADEENTIRIGNSNIAATFIRGISETSLGGGDAVFVNSNGRLGINTSSARFKDDIKPMGQASEAILALRPVSFRYKKAIDQQGIPQFGLVAEEVEKVDPNLITRDSEGKPRTVRYEQINAMLLNEFLKEHRKVQDLEKGMVALTGQLKEQAAQIQKVSAQLQVSKVAPKVVVNKP